MNFIAPAADEFVGIAPHPPAEGPVDAPDQALGRGDQEAAGPLVELFEVPGPGGLRLRHVPMDLSFAEAFGGRQADAYERLLMDVVRGNPMLFMRRDEVEAAWKWIDPIRAGLLCRCPDCDRGPLFEGFLKEYDKK